MNPPDDSLKLEDIQPEQEPSTTAGNLEALEVEDYASRTDYEAQLRQFHIYQLTQESIDRSKYSKLMFGLIIGWLSLVMLTVWLDGLVIIIYGIYQFSFNIPEDVLMVLLGSTTVNVVGSLWIVMRYMYRSSAGVISPVPSITEHLTKK